MIEKIKKIVSDICIAAISIVTVGFIGVLVGVLFGFFYMLIKGVVSILGFLFLCLLGGFAGMFDLFEYLSGRSENQDNKKVKKTY